MARNPRYDLLFEPVTLGPVTAPNRFYQVPHCSGMGYQRPNMMATMRSIKAEGGWGVVCTEYCSIDSGSDSPYPHASLRDDDDVSNLRAMTEAVHRHGALAGVELWYGGPSSANIDSRATSLGVMSSNYGLVTEGQTQCRAMDKTDIADFINMHRQAAKRALQAGFDIVYVYSNHEYLLHNFLDPYQNRRNDEYGGTLTNRIRLLTEVIDAVGEVIAGKAALAVRFSVEPDPDADHEQSYEALSLVAELPDLWDITVRDYYREMGSARFIQEASHGDAYRAVKQLTSKPVVGVGRFTSPDTMVQQIKSGNQDFIGAARPSIADPFLPSKINEGREDDIRECIGCNVCYATDMLHAPVRCTQNPTMGEEWRRGWHPEIIEDRHADSNVLVIGAGPAGMEAAWALGQRGYEVTLVDAQREMGGRINLECQLPGLASLARVRDWRIGQIEKLNNVSFYPSSNLHLDNVIELGYSEVFVATGSDWRIDGQGRRSTEPYAGFESSKVVSVNQVLNGNLPTGRVLIYDDDHYYLGSAIAMRLVDAGCQVVIATPEDSFASWTRFTQEHGQIMQRLLSAGVKVVTAHELQEVNDTQVQLNCIYTGTGKSIGVDAVIPVTSRQPRDDLWNQLSEARSSEGQNLGSVLRIGDCEAPGTIAAAIYSGHRAAREFGSVAIPSKRDRALV